MTTALAVPVREVPIDRLHEASRAPVGTAELR